MTAVGQKRKSSERADVSRFALEGGELKSCAKAGSRRPPVRVRRPVRPHIGSDQAADRADHPGT